MKNEGLVHKFKFIKLRLKNQILTADQHKFKKKFFHYGGTNWHHDGED